MTKSATTKRKTTKRKTKAKSRSRSLSRGRYGLMSPPNYPRVKSAGVNYTELFEPKTTKHYTERASPPYAANESINHGVLRIGNDGHLYQSRPDKNGVYHWKKR